MVMTAYACCVVGRTWGVINCAKNENKCYPHSVIDRYRRLNLTLNNIYKNVWWWKDEIQTLFIPVRDSVHLWSALYRKSDIMCLLSIWTSPNHKPVQAGAGESTQHAPVLQPAIVTSPGFQLQTPCPRMSVDS